MRQESRQGDNHEQEYWQEEVPIKFIAPFQGPRKWLMVNYVITVAANYLASFYIFRGEWIRDD
jgi:hypothetical protein